MTGPSAGLSAPEAAGREDSQALAALARQLADHLAGQPALAERAERLAERTVAQQFHIAIVGEFKRGKSTLVNALVGRPLLPSGVLPLTAVATEVHFGTPGTTVVFADGRRVAIAASEIGTYVTERENPSNERGVRRVEVGVEEQFGAPGVVLVDTPGVASVHEHNTRAAGDALAASDGAVLVLSVDSPLSASEEEILTQLGERGTAVFVVLNKCDHLSATELGEVRAFVAAHCARLLGREAVPYCLAARAALEAAAAGAAGTAGTDGAAVGADGTDGAAGIDDTEGAAGAAAFLAFRDELLSFVRDDLAAARRASALAELQRLGAQLAESARIEEAAAALDVDLLATRVGQFEDAAAVGRERLDEDRVVLDHEVAGLAVELGAMLATQTAEAARACQDLLAPHPAVPFRQLDGALQDAVASLVREGFEPVRRSAEREAEARWSAIAERFGARVQGRVDDLRAAASALFDVHLPVIAVPTVREQRERFSYLFVHVASPTAEVGQLLRSLLPTRGARRRAVRAAQRRLAEELDKHAGRARHDLAERLEAAKRQLVEEMTAELDRTEESILAAAGRARAALDLTARQQEAGRRRRSEALAVVHDVAGVAARG